MKKRSCVNIETASPLPTMKKTSYPSIPILLPILLLSLLSLSGCAVELPVVTPAPVVLATPAPVTDAPPVTTQTQPAGVPRQEGTMVVTATITPAAVVEAPTAAPTPMLSTHPTVTETLAAGLEYVRLGFKLKMPPVTAFTPVQPPADLEGVSIEQALTADGWVAVISPVKASASGRSYRTIIFSKDTGKKVMRWWGQVDDQGLASTVVFTGMPRPKSTRVKGIAGRVVQLPPGSAYPRYFEDEEGRRYGVATNKEAIQPLLKNLTEEDGRVQVWGELRYAVDDVNGRRILVRKYNLLDVAPEEVLARAASQVAGQPDGGNEETGVAPYAIVVDPLPHTVIRTQVQVAGEAGGLAGDHVILRVEHEDGGALGEMTVPLAPAASGTAAFSTLLSFKNPPVMSRGRIAVYAPAGGEFSLLGWTEVRFAGDVGDKRVTILQPEAGAGIRGQVQAAGRAENIPSGQLLVRVEDAAGIVLGKARAAIEADGGWRVQVTFRRPKTARRGVIAVYVPGSESDGLILLAQIPVQLKR